MFPSFALLLDVHAWQYRRWRCLDEDNTGFKDLRQISLTCSKNEYTPTFTVYGRQWHQEIRIYISVGQPFRFEKPEHDVGAPFEIGIGQLFYYPSQTAIEGNVLVTKEAFEELLTNRDDLWMISFEVVGQGADLGSHGPEWHLLDATAPTKEVSVGIYNFEYYFDSRAKARMQSQRNP